MSNAEHRATRIRLRKSAVAKAEPPKVRQAPDLAESEAEELVVRPKIAEMPDFGVVVLASRHGSGFLGQLQDPYGKFLLIIAGHARWDGDGQVVEVGPNMLFHIAEQTPHRQQDLPNDPVTLYAVHYRKEILSGSLYAELAKPGLWRMDLGNARIDQVQPVRSLFQEMLFEQSNRRPGWETTLVARLLDLAVLMVRLKHRTESCGQPIFVRGNTSAERVANYALRLKSQFFRQQSLAEAARSVSFSRRQFTELFRRVTGESWGKQIQRLRLEHALKLLTETNKSVAAVAFECGFEDLSHFHRSFKETYGSTPMTYRGTRK